MLAILCHFHRLTAPLPHFFDGRRVYVLLQIRESLKSKFASKLLRVDITLENFPKTLYFLHFGNTCYFSAICSSRFFGVNSDLAAAPI